ncbi:tetratricopeptide repeat protein 4-like [Ostrea edulis]|uniref:tetratricopeptide repeat protein 4-like n=1 Tax=Ostrea edulis TaxID=37623 RepID=UPI002094867F|nr:tetratricopeptide repeat protein 4-like [Ostrea edulis]XP_048759201.1 tetratricopeptide repeat protein 4-like [Ostrea edulis]XP_048759202.1 tetratricopeptide repeat protein 4-like [Ostrea edulis]
MPETKEEKIRRLNQELEDFIAAEVAKSQEKKQGDEKSFEEVLNEIENHPAFLKDIDYSKPLSQDMEGLMRLKYEQQDPTSNAESFKEDGNVEFKKKRYDIAIDNYTAGIKFKCPDKALNAVLYTNRAAAQFHKQNYRSAFQDAIIAHKFKPDHMKAVIRGAQCCMEMKKYSVASLWSDFGLAIEETNTVLLDIKQKAEKYKSIQEKEERKEAAKERKELAEHKKLITTIKSHGIRLAGLADKGYDPLLFTNVELHNPSGATVYVDGNDTLHWPVLFMYPEHTQTDYIEDFNENSTFQDHLLHMFGPDVPPASWDLDKKYKPDDFLIYYEDKEKTTLHQISQSCSLLKALQNKWVVVEAGTPCFIILVNKSRFHEHFVKEYTVFPS